MKNNKFLLIYFGLIIFLSGCSFDSKTGIWSGSEKEKKRITQLEEDRIKNTEKIYSSEDIVVDEILSEKNINLSEPKKNNIWKTSNFNEQNFIGHLYLTGINKTFLKKKIGKNKFSLSNVMSSPVIGEDFIIMTDNTGTIFNISKNGKINWKKNIYKKIYKKIYKNLSISLYKDSIFVADNIGFIYSIEISSGKILWLKNHGIPLKSKIKIFDDKVFLVNSDNRIICLDTKKGTQIWDARTVSSFIKTQNFLALAISKDGEIITINSSGDLIKLSSINGQIYWSLNITPSLFAHDKDFFESSDIVIDGDDIIFSTTTSIFSYNINTRFMNWKFDINSINTPIIDGKNVFLVSKNGFFINIDKDSGKIIWSTNIFKILKERKRDTNVTGFILGSNKIYSITYNGFLITSSAIDGKTETYNKIGDSIIADPIISDGSLYILTKNQKLMGFN